MPIRALVVAPSRKTARHLPPLCTGRYFTGFTDVKEFAGWVLKHFPEVFGRKGDGTRPLPEDFLVSEVCCEAEGREETSFRLPLGDVFPYVANKEPTHFRFQRLAAPEDTFDFEVMAIA